MIILYLENLIRAYERQGFSVAVVGIGNRLGRTAIDFKLRRVVIRLFQ